MNFHPYNIFALQNVATFHLGSFLTGRIITVLRPPCSSAQSHMMTHAFSRPIVAFFIAFSILTSLSQAFQWNETSYKGNKYIPLRKVKEFYEFKTFKRSGRKIIISNPGKAGVTLQFHAGGQEVLMNGVKFIFSNAIVLLKGSHHVSSTDLIKVIHPILRPDEIRTAKAFDTVIIDPGHGGKDAGAVNRLGTEAGYNLKVARLLKDNLTKKGFKVVMTRESNIFLSLKQRVEIANRHKNAIFISIHFNAVGRGASRARGIETFTLSPVGVAHYGRSIKASDFQAKPGNYQDSANIALATAVHWGTLMTLNKRGMKVPDRGIRRARYSVLTGVKHPSILFEGGFLSHPSERRLIHSPNYQRTLAKSIAEAIAFYRKATLNKPRRKAQ